MGLAVRLNKGNGVGWGSAWVVMGLGILVTIGGSVDIGMFVAGGIVVGWSG